ncbi:Wyosine base formation domain protein [Ferroglobus placidus DSM 10642]|uniref:S-adenosyl-L-methionine-dependent tRNA 4-demethylwyosine synthase n=1 Tax=Ferroglobus placidus (strain DSM 10642 / AEDII12DO) TaxID=589924 RepID=D3S0A1_FERPA|nr:4-demethylwyosine synthase TYW1 [Ferroglobus placidus]ADC66164.1 Wyosine base formation domain protein [Ferroglobus placidus DSM 10642]
MAKTLADLKGYHIVGKHSAVKTCLWLKKSLKDEGYCYKQKFYGIPSHRCLQMSPALICNLSCVHCWRPLDLMPPFKEWDEPEFIVEESIKAQRRLLSGFFGTAGVNRRKLEEALNPKHVAISLIGEPTLYPRIDELVDEYKKRNFTTFLVTNGTNPQALERVEPYQLYLSLTAYDEESHKALQGNKWDKIEESLRILPNLDFRTVIRLTLIKDVNMKPEKFAEIIDKASPDFVEAKAYMYLGYSRRRLKAENMPEHEDVRRFAEELAKLTGYEIKDESEVSRVVLLVR